MRAQLESELVNIMRQHLEDLDGLVARPTEELAS